MTFPYLRDLLAQPQALANTLSAMLEMHSLASLAGALQTGQYRRIVLTGMGSSFYATYPLALRLTAAGHWVVQVETSELNYYYSALLAPDTLLVVVSQSGASAETLRLLELNASRATVVGVTNEPQSSLARAASTTILTHAGPEASVSCKTYLATLIALAWLGDQLLAGESEPWIPEMEGIPQVAATYLGGWRQHVEWLEQELRNVRHCFLVGRGPSLAAVGTGALILKEASHLPAEGLSSAMFRHGPLEIVSPATYVLGFAGVAETAALNARLISDVVRAGGRGAMVGFDAAGPYRLPSAPVACLSILEILPVQMMTVALAALYGFEPGRFRLGSKITTVE